MNILSGGAAQGLVASLAPKFKAQTGFDIAGEFGAVGAMADKLRARHANRHRHPDVGHRRRDWRKRIGWSPPRYRDIGLVETAVAVRAGDPLVTVKDAAALRDALLAADAIFVPDTKASTAGIHVAKVLQQLGIADDGRGPAQNLPERRDRDAPSG